MRVRKKKQPAFQVLNNETQQYDRNSNNFIATDMSPDSIVKGDIDIVKNVCFSSHVGVVSGSDVTHTSSTSTSGTSSCTGTSGGPGGCVVTGSGDHIEGGVCASKNIDTLCHAIDCIDLVNFNVNLKGSMGDSKCACCDKHISQIMASSSSSTSSQDNVETADSEESISSSSCSTDKQNNSIPKARSRIRTNPWLPSPRPTPSTSPTYSSSSSSLTSHSTPSPMISPHESKGRFSYPAVSGELRSINERVRLGPDRSWTRKFVLTNLNYGGGCRGRLRGYYLSDSDEQSPIAEKTGSITEEEEEEEEDDDGYFDHRISFEYEETLENLLEAENNHPRNARYLSIQDLLTEESLRKEKRRSTCSDFSVCHDDSCDEGMAVDGISNDLDSSIMSSTLSSELTDIRETDTGYSSLTFDSPSSEVDKDFECITTAEEEEEEDDEEDDLELVEKKHIRRKILVDERIYRKEWTLEEEEEEEDEEEEEEEEEGDLLDLFRDDFTDDEVVATLDKTAIKVLRSTDCSSDEDELRALEASEKACRSVNGIIPTEIGLSIDDVCDMVTGEASGACVGVGARARVTGDASASTVSAAAAAAAGSVMLDSGGCVAGAIPRRSLNEIKSSLEEKVYKLRQEKQLVEQKIREAKEAEKIRVQEKKKLQKHVIMHRKQMLLQTLTSLKERLESQSTRLQSSYSAVLSMQRRFAQRQSPLLLISASSS